MTHAIDDDLSHPDVVVEQTEPAESDTNRLAENQLSGVSDNEVQWQNDPSNPGTLESVKSEEKVITLVKKVPVPIPVTKHGVYDLSVNKNV